MMVISILKIAFYLESVYHLITHQQKNELLKQKQSKKKEEKGEKKEDMQDGQTLCIVC